MQPYKYIPVDENEVISDAVVSHHQPLFDHDWNDYGAIWAADEVRQALESGDMDRAADLAEQMSDSDINIFD